MRHIYRDNAVLCRAPILGNGDVLFPMDAEGAISERLPTPPGLPSSAIYRLARPLEGGKPFCYGNLYPELSYMGFTLAAPYTVTTEFSTDEAVFSSVAKYDHGITVETRACAFHNRPLIVIQKKFSAQGPFHFAYRYKKGDPLALSAEGGMLLGERTLKGGREKLCFFSSVPLRAECTEDGGRLFGTLLKNATVTFYLFFADSSDTSHLSLLPQLSDVQSYVYKTGENRLFNEHIAANRAYREECELSPEDRRLALLLDGSHYLLRVFAGKAGSPLLPNHPHAPFGEAPSLDLRVLSALLHSGHFADARLLLDRLFALLPLAEGRYAGAGKGARYPYYADLLGNECLPDDARRDRVIQSADVAVAFYKYYRFTEDRAFLTERAYPVARSVAQYLLARGVQYTAQGARVSLPDPLFETAPEVAKPLLTTVAVASALSAFCELSALMRVEDETVQRARRAHESLIAGLPMGRDCYAAHEGADMPGRAPLFLYPYRTPLKEEPHRKSIIYAGLTASRVTPPPYDNALLALAYANRHLSALSPLLKVAETADEFGFLPPAAAEGVVEMNALFLDGVCRSLVAYEEGVLYVGFGLDADEATDGEFMIPLPIGATVEGRVRGGRFVSLRIRKHRGSKLSHLELVMPKWLYADGAAVAVRKSERGGVMYITTVAH